MKIDRCKKLVCNLYNKENYVMYIIALKQTLHLGLILEKVQKDNRIQPRSMAEALHSINKELRIKFKNDFENILFKFMNNSVFRKTIASVRKHRLVANNRRSCHLVLKPNYCATKRFSEKLKLTEMNKTEVKMNKLVYLGLLTQDISKIVMYEYWYDFVKLKYGDNAKLCYTDTNCFKVHAKFKDIYVDLAKNVDEIFNTSNYEVEKPIPIGKNKKVIGLMNEN